MKPRYTIQVWRMIDHIAMYAVRDTHRGLVVAIYDTESAAAIDTIERNSLFEQAAKEQP